MKNRCYLSSLIILIFLFQSALFSQEKNDSISIKILSPVMIESKSAANDFYHLQAIKETFIYSGKKNEVINLVDQHLTLTEKYARQIFAKIPGVFVYDMDGTGNQTNISTRGLDPHRGWEFNIRKDGIITNSDIYGYPASHYNIPMEAVERIELVRGTGSLQYGAQFGGMLNYISKIPVDKPFGFESINTVGTYGLLSTYNAVSGSLKKLKYSAWFNNKSLTGYRKNGDSKYNAEGVSLFYDFNNRIHLKLDWTHSNYLIHLAGPLTDSMFYADPRSSTRSRNYYNPDIYIPSLQFYWQLNASWELEVKSSAVLGARNSVMFDKPINVLDTIDSLTLNYTNRQIDIDHFNSYTNELRLLKNFSFIQQTSTMIIGVQYMHNDLHRQQLGKGSTGSDFDMNLVSPGWGRDLHFKTKNVALFTEWRLLFTKRLSVNPGIRYEMGRTKMSGNTTYYADTAFPNEIKHHFPLIGINAQYDLLNNINIYGGWSQAYRPVIFKDIVPQSIYEKTDKNLKDAQGYNAELGFRGSWKYLKWDLTAFYLKYNHRMGTLAQSDSINSLIIYRTNIGDSHTKGIESFVQTDFPLGKQLALTIFSSTSWMDARYQNALIRIGSENVNIDGNKVESVPSWISRNGVSVRYHAFIFSAIYSYVSDSYADALNTRTPSVSGAVGRVPAYDLLDLSLAVRLYKQIKLQLNANNVFNKSYFTKRPLFYPGPGIWPSDGRTVSVSISFKL